MSNHDDSFETIAHPVGGSSIQIKFSRLMLSLSSLLSGVGQGFRSLDGSPQELWKAYALKFLDSYAYFSFSVIFTLFLSNDFGFSDVEAGTIYGAWGALITIYGLFAGCLVDNIGVAKSLQVGFVISLISRCFIFITTSRTMLLLQVCVLLPIGNCLGIPVLTTGIRRYTNEQNRGFAFGLFYVIMNVAALLSGPVVDACTILYKHDDEPEDASTNTTTEWSLTGYRMVVLTGVVANIIAVIVTFTVREIKIETTSASESSASSSSLPISSLSTTEKSSIDLEQDDSIVNTTTTSSTTSGAMDTAAVQPSSTITNIATSKKNPQAQVSTFTPLKGSAWAIFKETIQTKNFWRFLVVTLITINVRMIFRHLDATLPKYMIREFGPDTPKGTIYSINPALIIMLVPLVTAGTSHIDPLVMIHHGTYVSALSVFFLVISTSIWSSVMFVVVLSIGEAIWSPRLYDYTMSISKEGREGTYMALSSAPLFLAKLPVGYMSGKLLEQYCPIEGPRNSKRMWLIIALTTISSPILLTIFWGYISKKETDDGSDIHYTELKSRPTNEQEVEEEQSEQTRLNKR